MVPEINPEKYQWREQSGHRRFIIESVSNYEEDNKEFLQSIPCITSFLKRCIKLPAWTSLMILDKAENAQNIAQTLTTGLHDSFAFFRRTVYTEIEIFQSASNAIILMPNASSLENSHYILSPCDLSCPFVTILITPFDDEERFLEEADIVAHSMWARRISTFIILARVGDSVLAAGSLTYETDKPCTPSSPVILDRCGAAKSWSGSIEIKTPEMADCILKIAYFEEPPYVVTVNDSEQLFGFEGSLTEEIMKNQQIDRERVEWNDNTSYAEQAQLILREDLMADLVIGRILQQSQNDLSYSTTYDMLKVVWVIPKVPKVSLEGLVQPFHPYVWAAIGGSLLLVGLAKIFFHLDLSWLNIFALIIGVAIARQPSRLSRRIQFIVWAISGLFLTQVYVDSLADQLINMSGLKIDTMEDLVSSSFEIGGTGVFANLFEGFEETDEIATLVREKFVTFDLDDYTKQLDDLLDGRNSTFALVAVLNSSRSDAIETVYAYAMTTEVICSFPLALACRKGFPYLRKINGKILDYIDLGIFDFMIQLAIGKDTRARLFLSAQNEEYMSKLHLQHFVPAILLMIIGFSSGLMLLILEIVLYPSELLK